MVHIANNLKKCSGIYVIMNVFNKKMYIGSSGNIYNRLQKHFSLLRHNKHENIKLQNSFNKHGEKYFSYHVLEFCYDTLLLEKEQYYIDKLKPTYNITLQVERNILSIESRLKISNTLKQNYKNGYIQTQHTEIDVYDLKGNFLKSYYSASDCYKDLKIAESSIFRCLNGKFNQCKGYMFYKKGTKNIKSLNLNSHGKIKKKKHITLKSKSFKLIDNKGNEQFFNSLAECSEKLNISMYLIRKAYNNKKLNDYLLAPVKLGEFSETPEVDNTELR